MGRQHTLSTRSNGRRKPHEVLSPALSLDTDPRVESIQLEILRRMPPWKKAELIDEAIRTSYGLALAGLRHRHPQAQEEELHRRLAGLILGEELATRTYGPPIDTKLRIAP